MYLILYVMPIAKVVCWLCQYRITGDTVLCVSFALPRIVLSYGTLPKQTRDTVLSISRAVLGIDAIV